MEKKTIGKFISALRRANGMTQKELGEKLFVSDKTVSRWERDECTPELSLIPVIAEIFGITTDELLRGERNNPDKDIPNPAEVAAKQKAKSDKQFRVMLYNRLKKYKNLTLISVGISILGLIAAMIANFGFLRATVGFGLASAFMAVGEICQIGFAVNAWLMEDEEDDSYRDQIKEANAKIAETAIIGTLCNVLLWAFCLPLATVEPYFGLVFEAWSFMGLVTMPIALLVCYLAYVLFVRPPFAKRGIIAFAGEHPIDARKERNLLAGLLVICGAVVLVAIFFANTLDPILFAKRSAFDDPYEFKTFIEGKTDEWLIENYGCTLEEALADDSGYYSNEIEVCRTKDAEGNTVEIYYRWGILSLWESECTVDEATSEVEFDIPVKVVLDEDYQDAQWTINSVAQLIVLVDLVVCVTVYIVKLRKMRKI